MSDSAFGRPSEPEFFFDSMGRFRPRHHSLEARERNLRVQRARFAPPEERFWAKVDLRGPDECWPWKGAHAPNGYGITRTWGAERRQSTGAHRAVWIFTHGPIPDGLYVCHHCDNPPCCNPAHLFLGTPRENLDDMRRKGRERILLGRERFNAKFDEAAIRDIRARYAAGEKQRLIAKHYGVGQPRISKIVRREAWAWLQ